MHAHTLARLVWILSASMILIKFSWW